MLRGIDIVCISSLDWNAMWTSKHQVMHRLARTNRVLYVEEPVTMLAPLRVPSRWKRWTAVAPKLERVEPGLWTLAPPPTLPFGNMSPRLNSANQMVLARYVRWAIERIPFDRDYILWTYLPTSLALLDRLGASPAPGETGGSNEAIPARRSRPGRGEGRAPSLVVYHCVDEHSAFPGFVTPGVVKAYDDGLTRRADLVVTTSDNLRLSRQELNPATHTVLNAADVELFNRSLELSLPVAADLATIPAPRLGVVGLHDSRLDVAALEVLAQADEGWHIVLIGPVKPGQVDEPRLRSFPNIHFLGEKPRSELPAYLKGLAVALIPYKATELTRNIFPLKLFEYLAAGLPVVVGGLPELRRFEGIIRVADTPADYPDLVRGLIAADDSSKRAERVALAAENTWDHRVEEISALVREALERRSSARGVIR